MLLHEIIARAAAADPDGVALVFDDQPTTFAELDQRIDRLASAVAICGQPGDRIAFVGENTSEWIDAYYGVPRGGRVLAFVNHRLSTGQIRETIGSIEPVVLVAGEAQLDALRAGGGTEGLAPIVVNLGTPAPGEWSYDDFISGVGADGDRSPGPSGPARTGRGIASPDPADTAWLISTSGTSGTPKFVELSHTNLMAAVRATTAVRPIGRNDRYLFPFPLCHVAGYNILMFHDAGRPVVLLPRFDPASFVEQVGRHEVSTASLAPTMIHLLTDHLDQTGGSLEPLRTITYGSSAITPSLLALALRRLGTDFNQGYGMTELSGNAVFLGAEEHRRGVDGEPWLLGMAGRPSPLVDIRIVDDDGSDVPTRTAGEVAVRGDQVMKGYWNAPEANAAAFLDGWFRTGDIGVLDDEGWLAIVDRKKDIIVSGGENVSSREVEELLTAHPDIAEVAVVSQPDVQWGEVVCAVVVLRRGATIDEDDVLAYGRSEVGGYKQPRRVLIVDALPRNAAGKVLKTDLRAQIAATSTTRTVGREPTT